MTNQRNQRQIAIAVEIVREVEAGVVDEHLPADALLGQILRKHPGFGSKDRRHYSQAVFAYFRWLGWTTKLSPDPTTRCAWAMLIDPATSPDVRAIWREIPGVDEERALKLGQLNTDGTGRSIGELMPAWLEKVLPDPNVRLAFIKSTLARPPTWLAVAPEKTKSLSATLGSLGIIHEVSEKIRGAIAVQPPFTIDKIKSAWRSPVQVQDLASQVVTEICAARTGEHWWDACAGSGGKTLALARAVGANGSVLATDVRASILQNLKKRAEEFHGPQIRIKELDAAQDKPKAQFDGVLVDAPCSGLGTWPRNPDARWRASEDLIEKSASTQALILHQASECVQPGGVIIYSVCTITPRETTEVVRSFLDAHTDFELTPFMDPLKKEKTNGTCQILPGEHQCDGMFIAKFVRRTF